MHSAPIFKPYVKVILQLSDSKQIALTELIDTRAVSSIIHGNCLPTWYHVPTQVSFTPASGDQFYSHKYIKPIKLLPFGKRHSFFTYDSSAKDVPLGTDFVSFIASFTFHPKRFGYTITSPVDQKPYSFMIPWVEQQSIFGSGDKRKIQKSPVQKFEI